MSRALLTHAVAEVPAANRRAVLTHAVMEVPASTGAVSVGLVAATSVALAGALSVGAPPAAPSGVSATAQSASEISVAWTAPNDAGLSVRIHRRDAGAGSFHLVAEEVSTESPYLDIELDSGTLYEYYLTAWDGAQESDPSSTVNATTEGGVTLAAAISASSAGVLSVTTPAASVSLAAASSDSRAGVLSVTVPSGPVAVDLVAALSHSRGGFLSAGEFIPPSDDPITTESTFELWSDPEYTPDSERIAVLTGVLSGDLELSVEQDHALTLRALRHEWWTDEVRPGRVIRATVAGEVTEWWIGGREDIRDESNKEEMVVLYLDPLHCGLADIGVIEDVQPGGERWSNLGGVEASARNYLTSYCLPALAGTAMSACALGTVAPSGRMTIAWDALTRLSLIQRVAGEADLEWQLRRDDDAGVYRIDMVEQIGSGLADAWASVGHNILTITRTRDREDLRTVIRPVGALPDGGEQRSGIGDNAWRVTAVSGSLVTLEAHEGGYGPIAENGQWVGRYLLKEDGTTTEIVSADPTTQEFQVADATAISVGDDVSIRADADGTWLGDLESPAGVSAFRRIAGPVEFSGRRGERNWAKNPLFRSWDPTPTAYACQRDSGGDTTNHTLKGLPPGLEIQVGDALLYPSAAAAALVNYITAPATVSGGGTVTVTISAALTIAENTGGVLIHHVGRLPDRYVVRPEARQIATPAFTPQGASQEISATVDGAQTIGGPNPLTLALTGLTPGQTVYPGYLLRWSGQSMWVAAESEADGSGNLTVTVLPNTAHSPGDTDPVTIHAPHLPRTPSGTTAGQFAPRVTTGSSPRPRLMTDPIRITPQGGSGSVWASVKLDAMAAASGPTGGWDPVDDLEPPRLLILDEAGTTILESVDADPWEPAAVGEMHTVTLRRQISIEGTTALRVAVQWPARDEAAWRPQDAPWMWMSSLMVHTSPDARAPVVEGSHATRMIADGQIVLRDSREWGASYEVDLLDLAHAAGVEPPVARAALGAWVRVQDPGLGLDTLLRIESIRVRTEQPENPTLVLSRRPDLLTAQVRRQRTRTLFASVEIPELDIRKTVIPTEDPPPAPGIPRTEAPSDEDLESDAPLPIVPLILGD